MIRYSLFNEDFLTGVDRIQDRSIDLVIADPPYGLGKDYGNGSDMKSSHELIKWTIDWVDLVIPKLKHSASIYIFTTWRHSPEIFSAMKKRLTMMNEIIWDRCVPSMGGSTRRFSSVHDTIGFFVLSHKEYYFDLDAVRIPYDPETKKARTRSRFVGKKWLELGYNPKDVWRVSRLHRLHREREDHPTQKPLEIIERMVKASCPEGGVVLDPFCGSGTTIEASVNNRRNCIAFEINPRYCEISQNRIETKYSKRLV
ncbi:MAG: site-specific DNA-methyltransferase [Chloroflexi bacterium]|nr:site-specific DNA-methyltransferase [Chloroflexota bacterium]MCY4246358.1 site-specific DNA-methyltransferase [Chloroflexota bacterium]